MSACKRCGRAILWGCREQRDADGKRVWLPLDPEPDHLGIIELTPDKVAVFAGPTQDPQSVRYVPHEATCPAANTHTRMRPPRES